MTRYFRAGGALGMPASTRTVTITTGAPQAVILNSGMSGLFVMNHGPTNISWGGDASFLANTAGVLFPYSTYEWLNVIEAFTAYFRATSVASVLAVTEYQRV